MFSVIAVSAYVAAVAAGILLIRWFGPAHWSWHVLAILAALSLGMVPSPDSLRGPAADLAIGLIFALLTTWGIGGLAMAGSHTSRHKHA